MIAISGAFTQRSFKWTEFKEFQVKKSLVLQSKTEDGMYWIWGYNGPECFITQIWRNEVPYGVTQGGYTQEQNDLDKEDFETNYLADTNGPI